MHDASGSFTAIEGIAVRSTRRLDLLSEHQT